MTLSEINNHFFSLEHSLDGYTFTTVATVNAAGNSSSTLLYTAYDENPFSAITYYRLKQTDFDGKFTYSSVIFLFGNNKSPSSYSIYPNPANGALYFDFQNSNRGVVYIEIADVLGKTVVQKQIFQDAEKQHIELALPALQAGIYAARIIDESRQTLYVQKIVKE